jgi:hypothetical protein
MLNNKKYKIILFFSLLSVILTLLLVSFFLNNYSILYSGLLSLPFTIISIFINTVSIKPVIKNNKSNFNSWIGKYVITGVIKYVIVFFPLLIWIILKAFNYDYIFNVYVIIIIIVIFPLVNIAINYVKIAKKND